MIKYKKEEKMFFNSQYLFIHLLTWIIIRWESNIRVDDKINCHWISIAFIQRFMMEFKKRKKNIYNVC